MAHLAIAAAALIHVGLRAFQGINVVDGHWLRVPPTGLGIAVAEVVVVGGVVTEGWGAVLPLFLGGVLGCWSAMLANERLAERE